MINTKYKINMQKFDFQLVTLSIKNDISIGYQGLGHPSFRAI